MRPKASQHNLQLAAAFADCLTVRRDESIVDTAAIHCKGPASLFAALQAGIPEVVCTGTGCRLNGSISEIELNKFLSRSGYLSFRFRHRIRGTKDRWSKGEQLWKCIRWIDPREPAELNLAKRKLALLKTRFPGPHYAHDDDILAFLFSVTGQSCHYTEAAIGDRGHSIRCTETPNISPAQQPRAWPFQTVQRHSLQHIPHPVSTAMCRSVKTGRPHHRPVHQKVICIRE